MTAKGIKRRHHTTPRVYLRGFANEHGKVSVLTRRGKEAEAHISDTTVHHNFYNFRTSEGTETSTVEDWLDREVENPAGPVLKRLRADAPLEQADVPTISKFVAAQLLRTPAVAALLEQFDAHLGPMLVMQAVVTRRRLNPTELPAAEMEALLEAATRAWAVRADRDHQRSRLRTVMRKIDELADRFTSWHWSVLTSADDTLVTGDAPVATFQDYGRGWEGILPPGSPVYLPLSPRQLLVGEQHPLGPSTELSAELAATVNRDIARHATELIIKAPSQEWPSDLILGPHAPALSAPTVRWSYKPGEPPTLPATYPAVLAADIESVLNDLEAIDTVD